MDHIQGIDRNQISIFALEEMVAKDSWARLIDIFVDALPLDELGFESVQTAEEGRPPYHPGDLLKLYMYGYKYGLRTTRKLEHAAQVNVELWWLLKGLKPSNRAIAYFRKNNSKAFKNAFRYFVLVLKDWDLVEGDVIAIDSFKIRAQNSLKNNFNQKKIDRHLRYIDEKITEYEKQLDEEDEEEERKELQDKIDHQEKKKQEYNEIEKELKDSGESQIRLTDPNAKSVVMHRNIINVGYNIQAVSDKKNKLLVHADTGSVNDTRALAPVALASKELLARDSMIAIADKGYNTGEQLQICKDNDVITYVSPKENSTPYMKGFSIDQFEYNAETDTYTCPAEEELTTNGSYYKKGGYRIKQYKTNACKDCTIKAQCTQNKTGRLIERSEYQEVMEENRDRVLADPDYYRTRQQITEHQFGTIKRQWGFTHTLMKGKEAVLSEVHLLFTIYNLRRSVSILGLEELKKRLKALNALFFQGIWPIRPIIIHSPSSIRLAI
jgi:transposase